MFLTLKVLCAEKSVLGCDRSPLSVLYCLHRKKEIPMDDERDAAYWLIHQDQDDRGWFDDLGCSLQDFDEDAPF